MTFLGKKILETITYGDVFDYPLKLEEIKKLLIASSGFDFKVIRKETFFLLAHGLIEQENGFYFLKGRKKIVNLREERKVFSQNKLTIGQKYIRFLKFFPWIRAVAVTGAIAWDNASEDDDIDWLVITAPKRLWVTRFCLGLTLSILKVRRSPNQKKSEAKDKICLNMFLTEKTLSIPSLKQSLFTAHEVLQARFVYQRFNARALFIKKNSWVKKYLFNGYSVGLGQVGLVNKEKTKEKRPCWLIEKPMDWLDSTFFLLQTSYMKNRKTIEVIERERAFFHPREMAKEIEAKRRKRFLDL